MIWVVSLGVGPMALSPEAISALQQAKYVVGSERQWQSLGDLQPQQAQFYPLPPLKDLVPWLKDQSGPVVVLASGDGNWFGISRFLIKHFSERVRCISHVSSLQYAANRLAWPMQELTCLSVHGRPMQPALAKIRPHSRYLLLTDGQNTIVALANALKQLGYARARLALLSDLGYPHEAVQWGDIDHWLGATSIAELNVVAIESGPCDQPRPWILPDDAFITEGHQAMISKVGTRMAVIQQANSQAGDCVWDLGAGCGGISCEWARAIEGLELHAVEKHPGRFACLTANQQQFGLNNVHSHMGEALNLVAQLPDPDCVFIGGSDGQLKELLKHSWQRLPLGGKLMATAVTEDTKAILYAFADALLADGLAKEEAQLLHHQPMERLAGGRVFKPKLAVLLWCLTKEAPWPNS